MNDTVVAAAALLLGAGITATGLAVWLGRGTRTSHTHAAGQPAVMILGGSALLCLTGAAIAKDTGAHAFTVALAVTGVICALTSTAAGIVGTPRWARPRWQRDLESQ